jgi:hypothetical protein
MGASCLDCHPRFHDHLGEESSLVNKESPGFSVTKPYGAGPMTFGLNHGNLRFGQV